MLVNCMNKVLPADLSGALDALNNSSESAAREDTLRECLSRMVKSLYRLLLAYCSSALTNFSVTLSSSSRTQKNEEAISADSQQQQAILVEMGDDSNIEKLQQVEEEAGGQQKDTINEEEVRESSFCYEKLLLCVDSLHNIPLDWFEKYKLFAIEAHLVFILFYTT